MTARGASFGDSHITMKYIWVSLHMSKNFRYPIVVVVVEVNRVLDDGVGCKGWYIVVLYGWMLPSKQPCAPRWNQVDPGGTLTCQIASVAVIVAFGLDSFGPTTIDGWFTVCWSGIRMWIGIIFITNVAGFVGQDIVGVVGVFLSVVIVEVIFVLGVQ